MIEFGIDWYGSHARPGALGDYLELLALKDVTVSAETIADVVRDSQWTRLLWETIAPEVEPDRLAADEAQEESDLAESLDTAHEAVRFVLAELRERQDVLADAYPFRVSASSGTVLERRSEVTDWCPYDALLLLTIAHASEVETDDISLTDLFERVVEDSLRSHGLDTARLHGSGTDYASRATEAARRVGLTIDTSRSAHRRRAIDEGTDLVSNLWPTDPRRGGTQLIGQATCAKSDEWEPKLTEPKPAHWRDMLGSNPTPLRYLAVPHHVCDDYRRYLLGREDHADVMDRLRLALIERPILDDERRVCELLADQPVVQLI